jgi:hypothetical protein
MFEHPTQIKLIIDWPVPDIELIIDWPAPDIKLTLAPAAESHPPGQAPVGFVGAS